MDIKELSGLARGFLMPLISRKRPVKPLPMSRYRTLYFHGSMLFLLVALTMTITASLAQANGRIISYERHIAGPYEIAMGTIPDTPWVGTIHLSLTVDTLFADTPAPVLGALITIVGSGPDELQTEPEVVIANNNPANHRFYEAELTVDYVGVWAFDIVVDSDVGKASTTFKVNVREANPLPGLLALVLLSVLLLTLGLSMRSYLRLHRSGT